MISCVYVLIYGIKCIYNIEYKMYLQNKKVPKLWVFVAFSKKRRFKQIYKTSLQMKLWDKLEKDEFVGQCSVKKVFLKTLQNSQEKPLLESLF